MNSYLPDRETQVLEGICGGKTERRIALDMGCSVHNVKAAKAKLLSRFGALNTPHLVSQLYERGILKVSKSEIH